MDAFIDELTKWLDQQLAFSQYKDPRDALDSQAGHGRGQLAPDGR